MDRRTSDRERLLARPAPPTLEAKVMSSSATPATWASTGASQVVCSGIPNGLAFADSCGVY
jgi:hypothetical protein